MHGVKMKWVILGGKADGPTGGSPPMSPPKEEKKKRLKKSEELSSEVPLSMIDLIGKGKDADKKMVEGEKVP